MSQSLEIPSLLESLTRDRLVDLGRTLGVSVPAHARKERQIETLLDSRQLVFTSLLAMLHRDELKATCRALGLDDSGRARSALARRLMEAAGDDGKDKLVAAREVLGEFVNDLPANLPLNVGLRIFGSKALEEDTEVLESQFRRALDFLYGNTEQPEERYDHKEESREEKPDRPRHQEEELRPGETGERPTIIITEESSPAPKQAKIRRRLDPQFDPDRRPG